MNLETENRIAAILMKEASELRRQADKEGVHVYLQKPQARGRPNSRFLTATVLGVQQANRSVEVNEMWRVRQKELELDDRIERRSRDKSSNHRSYRDNAESYRSGSKRHPATDKYASSSRSPTDRESDDFQSREGDGLKDEEVEEFLQSRVKRGRGAIGPRMDEVGPYFLPESKEKQTRSSNIRLQRESKCNVLGPEKPFTLNHYCSSEEELDDDRLKKTKKCRSEAHHREKSRKRKSKQSKRQNGKDEGKRQNGKDEGKRRKPSK